MSQTASNSSNSLSPHWSPQPSLSDAELHQASQSPPSYPTGLGELRPSSHQKCSPTSPVRWQEPQQYPAFHGSQRLPAVAPQGRPSPRSTVASLSQSTSRGLSSCDVQALPSPFNSLLLLPSDDRLEALPGDIRPDSHWSLPQLCISLCAMVALLLAIFFASTLAVRTLQRYDFLRPDAAGRMKGPLPAQATSAHSATEDAECVVGLNVSDVAAYAPAFR